MCFIFTVLYSALSGPLAISQPSQRGSPVMPCPATAALWNYRDSITPYLLHSLWLLSQQQMDNKTVWLPVWNGCYPPWITLAPAFEFLRLFPFTLGSLAMWGLVVRSPFSIFQCKSRISLTLLITLTGATSFPETGFDGMLSMLPSFFSLNYTSFLSLWLICFSSF